jgi:hypothetical protein
VRLYNSNVVEGKQMRDRLCRRGAFILKAIP